MKDNFSFRSDCYAKFRPSYPLEIFDYLDSILTQKETAWDCGTGNGQIAVELSGRFKNVFATDISHSQISEAGKAPNIHYSVQPAEQTDFEENKFDLIIVGQAIHWFDFDRFYKEARRTSKKHALIVALGYARIQINPEIDKLISDFYSNKIGAFWDPERRFVDENYLTLPFPFEEIDTPYSENRLYWSRNHFIGYLNTWSAVRHFTDKKGVNPVVQFKKELKSIWKSDEEKEVRFPILLRIGKLH